jgi:hypothetical protein
MSEENNFKRIIRLLNDNSESTWFFHQGRAISYNPVLDSEKDEYAGKRSTIGFPTTGSGPLIASCVDKDGKPVIVLAFPVTQITHRAGGIINSTCNTSSFISVYHGEEELGQFHSYLYNDFNGGVYQNVRKPEFEIACAISTFVHQQSERAIHGANGNPPPRISCVVPAP